MLLAYLLDMYIILEDSFVEKKPGFPASASMSNVGMIKKVDVKCFLPHG